MPPSVREHAAALRHRARHGDLPEPLRTARSLVREIRTLALVGPSLARYAFISSQDLYRKSLPVQAPTRIAAPDASLGDVAGLRAWLGVDQPREGEDSLYLDPEQWQSSPLGHLSTRYPSGCGLKISKNLGGVDSHYLTSREGRRTQQQFSGTHANQLLTFNLLHLEHIAPRLFDLIELSDAEGHVRCAYILQHITGGKPDPQAMRECIDRLRQLTDVSLLHLLTGGGWSSIDFLPPDGNGNVVMDGEGSTYYVDVHNFTLGRYDRYISQLARTAAAATHFGNTSLLLGGSRGKYLYQEVPGVALPAKRSPRKRFEVFQRLMHVAGIDPAGKVVVDVGCNLGLMGAEHLRRGAAWLHGFDQPEVTPQAERVLLAIGCTRFSMTPMAITDESDLRAALPDHLRREGDLILNYLAVRKHIGWLPALRELSWRYMVYEGHQDDGPLDRYVAALNEVVPARVVARDVLADANSRRRDAAIIERLETAATPALP